MGADEAALSACSGTTAACVQALVKLQADAQAYLDQLSTVATPAPYRTADAQLRQGLADNIAGAQQGIAGLEANDPAQVSAGVRVMSQGLTVITTASQSIRTAAGLSNP